MLEGNPPFALANGSAVDIASAINEWSVKLGLMESVVDSSSAVDCSLMQELVESGYRQLSKPTSTLSLLNLTRIMPVPMVAPSCSKPV